MLVELSVTLELVETKPILTMVIATDQYAQMVVSWIEEMLPREPQTTINKENAHNLHARSTKDVNKMEFVDQIHANMASIISELRIEVTEAVAQDKVNVLNAEMIKQVILGPTLQGQYLEMKDGSVKIAVLQATLTEMEDAHHAIHQKEKFTTPKQEVADVTSGQEDNKMDVVDLINVPSTRELFKVQDHVKVTHSKVNVFHADNEKNLLLIVEDAI